MESNSSPLELGLVSVTCSADRLVGTVGLLWLGHRKPCCRHPASEYLKSHPNSLGVNFQCVNGVKEPNTFQGPLPLWHYQQLTFVVPACLYPVLIYFLFILFFSFYLFIILFYNYKIILFYNHKIIQLFYFIIYLLFYFIINIYYLVFIYFSSSFIEISLTFFLNSLKSLRIPKNFCVCVLYLLIFVILEIKAEKVRNIYLFFYAKIIKA